MTITEEMKERLSEEGTEMRMGEEDGGGIERMESREMEESCV